MFSLKNSYLSKQCEHMRVTQINDNNYHKIIERVLIFLRNYGEAVLECMCFEAFVAKQ